MVIRSNKSGDTISFDRRTIPEGLFYISRLICPKCGELLPWDPAVLLACPTLVPMSVTCECAGLKETVDWVVVRRTRYKVHIKRFDFAPSMDMVDRLMSELDRASVIG